MHRLQAHDLRGAETVLVKLQGARCVLDDQVGRDSVVAVGDGFDWHGYCTP